MPNIINDLGLQIKTREEIVTELITSLRAIYGNDINVDSDTPDGQLINIFAQSIVDTLELLMNIYNSFDPDNAVGVVLDQRVAINGIQRQQGTYTIQNVDITTTAGGFTLEGLDVSEEDAYTVADNAGNEWKLITSFVVPGAGSYSLAFRAAVPGDRSSLPNTITVPVTIALNVSAINNPTPYTTLGINEESDYDLKIRRQRSVSLPSQGYLEGLLAALENIPGVISASIYENNTGAPDMQSITSTYPEGTPSNCIWVVVDGTADPEEIAQAIYRKRNAGCNMRGDDSFVITQVDGSPFTIRWDFASEEDLFIRCTLTSLNGVQDVNYTGIRQRLPELFVPRVYEQMNVNDLATAIQEIDNNALVTNAGLGLAETGPFDPVIQPSSRDLKFVVKSENIILLPILIRPVSATVLATETRQLEAYGGYQSPLDVTFWSIPGNVSGASIDAETGLYTAGATPGVDTVRYEDSLGNTAEVSITVV